MNSYIVKIQNNLGGEIMRKLVKPVKELNNVELYAEHILW